MEEYRFCGPNALYACTRLAGLPSSRDDLIAWCNTDAEGGCSLADLVGAAKKAGFHHAVAVRLQFEDILSFGLPVILVADRVEPHHFFAVIASRGGEILILDQPDKSRWVTQPALEQIWSGYGALLSSKPIPLTVVPFGSSPDWAPLVIGLLGGPGAAVILQTIRFRRVPRPAR
jgi:hypothetical protein